MFSVDMSTWQECQRLRQFLALRVLVLVGGYPGVDMRDGKVSVKSYGSRLLLCLSALPYREQVNRTDILHEGRTLGLPFDLPFHKDATPTVWLPSRYLAVGHWLTEIS